MKYNYSEKYNPPAPVVKVTIMDTATGEYEVEALIDTSFSGGLLIPYDLYVRLGLSKLETSSKYYGVLPVGVEIPLFTAKTRVRIGDHVMEALLHAHPSINKNLLGRRILNNLKILLNGIEKYVSILNNIS